MSRKVFTAGEVLAAADVNSFLMDQTVMSFAGTAARGSAIPSPTLGMYTHLEDAPARTQFWNGSAWVSPFGLTLISTTTFTSQSSVDVTNVFSSAYENYRIVVTANSNAGTPTRLQARMLNGTTPAVPGYASLQVSYNLGASNLNNIANSTTSFFLGYMSVPNGAASITFDLTRPFSALQTGQSGFYVGDAIANFASAGITFGYHEGVASYDGIRFLPTGSTFTGTIRVYGYRNA